MVEEWGWRIAAILAFIYILEILLLPLVESPGDDGILEYLFSLFPAIIAVWLISILALALGHLVSIWRFSEQSYRQRVLVAWPVCISGLLLVLVIFTAQAFV